MTPHAKLADNLLRFGRTLRGAGLEVHHGRLIDAIRALEWIGVRRREDVQATLRSLLVHAHDDLERFDALFNAFLAAHAAPIDAGRHGERPPAAAQPIGGEPPSIDLEADTCADEEAAVGVYSATGVSRTKDFAEFTAAELESARQLLAAMPWRLGTRRTRRWERPTGPAIDLRRLVRHSVTRGDLMDLPRRRRRIAPRPIVILGDVSGSMERYSRMLLHFVHGLSEGAGHVESFVFATRLTRITRLMASRRGQDVSAVVREVGDWGGGTRIGDALRMFNTIWARRVMRHGPVLLLVSDGWDRGDPQALSRELARVHRSCRRLIWLNPLLGTPGYEPLTRGMQAALGHIDDFLPVHNLDSLERLAAYLRELPSPRRAPRVASR
jgi:uncharacterized protein with von Willebrand factor type A (vWA) domain